MNIFTIREALIRNSSSYQGCLIPFPEFNCWRRAQILSDRKNKESTDHTTLPNGRGPLDGDCDIINVMNALSPFRLAHRLPSSVTSNEKMSIHFLVNVEEENLAGGAEMTDQEIVDPVIAGELEENYEGEGGEEEADIELRPAERTTLKEAISALDVFLRFAMNGSRVQRI